MGMFDSIWFECPECGLSIEAQSKSGPCVLQNYRSDFVPADVAADANRHGPFKCKCGKSWVLGAPPVGYVSLSVTEHNQEPTDT